MGGEAEIMAEYTPPEIALEQRKIDRRRKMAELLAQQDPMQGQMVSGHYVGASPVQGIANLAKAYLGAKANRKLDTEETDLTTRDQQMRREDITHALTRMKGGTPNVNGVLSMMKPWTAQEGVNEARMSPRPEIQAEGQYRQGVLDTASDTAAQNAHEIALQELRNKDLGSYGNSESMSTKEWKYYSTLSPEQQAAYLEMKRAEPMLNRGNTFSTVNPITNAVTDVAPINLDPNQTPEHAADVVTAEEGARLDLLPRRGDLEAENTRKQKVAELTAEYETKLAKTTNGIRDIISLGRDKLTGSVKPTSSGFGTIYDAAAAWVGFAPDGSPEADSLRAIGGALVSKMPRMEGPQSDKDTTNYKEMAGRIGDSSLPIARRMEALATVEELWAKYAPQQPAAPAGDSSPSEGDTAVNPTTGETLVFKGGQWQ